MLYPSKGQDTSANATSADINNNDSTGFKPPKAAKVAKSSISWSNYPPVPPPTGFLYNDFISNPSMNVMYRSSFNNRRLTSVDVTDNAKGSCVKHEKNAHNVQQADQLAFFDDFAGKKHLSVSANMSILTEEESGLCSTKPPVQPAKSTNPKKADMKLAQNVVQTFAFDEEGNISNKSNASTVQTNAEQLQHEKLSPSMISSNNEDRELFEII